MEPLILKPMTIAIATNIPRRVFGESSLSLKEPKTIPKANPINPIYFTISPIVFICRVLSLYSSDFSLYFFIAFS